MRNSFVLMGSEILIKLKGLVLLPLLTKTFGAINYGIWSQIEVIYSMLAPVAIMGLDSASIRFASGKPRREISSVLATVLSFSIGIAMLFAIILSLCAIPIAGWAFAGEHNAKFVILCGFTLIATILLSLVRTFFILIDGAVLVSLMRTAESFLPLISISIILIGGYSLFALISTNIAVLGLVALAFLFILVTRLGLSRPQPSILPQYLKYGAAVMPMGYAMWVLNLSDRLFLSAYQGLSEVGAYAAATSVGYLAINIFFNPFWIMYPARAADYFNTGRQNLIPVLFRNSTKTINFFIIPSIAGLWLLGPSIMGVLATDEFVEGGRLLPLITIGYSFLMFASYFSINLGLKNRNIISTANSFIAAGVNLLGNFLFIPKYGMTGAAASTCFAFALQFILEFITSRKIFPIRMTFDWLALAKAIGAAGFMSSCLVFFGLDNPENILNLIGSVLTGCVLYTGAQLILKYFSGNEAHTILDTFGLSRTATIPPVKWIIAYLGASKSG